MGSLLAAVVFAAGTSLASPAAIELFVRPGMPADFADGSAMRPFPTLHAARDHIRRLRALGDTTLAHVSVGPGIYTPLELNQADHHIVFEGRGDNSSLISGGVQLLPSAFRPWEGGQQGVLQADLNGLQLSYGSNYNGSCFYFASHPLSADHGFDDPPIGLVLNGVTQTPARWPNLDATTGRYSWQFIDVGYADGFGVNDTSVARRMLRWNRELDPWIHDYLIYDWADAWHRPAQIMAKAGGGVSVQLEGKLWRSTVVGQAKFYGSNLLSELDQPGEWYIDRHSHTLYFMPPNSMDTSSSLFLTQALSAVHLNGASEITLRGLTIQHARGAGVVGDRVDGVRIERCHISGHGQHGVVLRGRRSGVDSSTVSSTGCSGVWVVGGVARELIPGEMFATGNQIDTMALWTRAYQPGVMWQGVGNNYSSNVIRNSPHNCITGGGNANLPFTNDSVEVGAGSECVFENNTLDTCVYECIDWCVWPQFGKMRRH